MKTTKPMPHLVLSPALRPDPTAISGAFRQKQIHSSLSITNVLTQALFCLLFTATSTLADGFNLEFSLETNPHVTVHLSPEQIIEVGRTRRLVLTQEQKEKLGYNLKNVPDVFGVESLREPTCSCCISPAMWTDTDKVTVWLDRSSETEQFSQHALTARQKDLHFVMDSEGRIFHKGTEVSFDKFSDTANTKNGVKLAMPPVCPPDVEKKIDVMISKGRVSFKL
jgi:hypothetical protein